METVLTEEHIITEKIEFESKQHPDQEKGKGKGSLPKDAFLICHILFLVWGIAHPMSMTFFGAANNFWMYKFRNLSDPTMAAGNRTSLQTHFASSSMIANTVPGLLFGMWNIVYGHKFKILNRIILTFIIEAMVFFVFTAFVKIDTDSYETGFFVMVMLAYVVMSGASNVNMVASTLLYPRFPVAYMKTCMIGEGFAGIVGDVLNVISVAIFDDVRDSTLMYFLFGSVVITSVVILTVVASRTEFFKHSLNTMPENHTKPRPQKGEIIKVLWKIKLNLFLTITGCIAMSATHTSITSLVVSEQSNSSVWASKFFTPVLTFLWCDLGNLLGRVLSTHTPLQFMPDTILYILGVTRTIVLVPFIWFCNAQPRSHLTVLFPHDYQYAIIMGVFMTLNGYLMNMGWLVMSRRTTRYESEIAYTVFSLIMGVLTTLSSPIGMFIVHIL